MRWIGLGVHRDFCAIAIREQGELRSVGRVSTRMDAISALAQSLLADDVVVIKATTGSGRIISLLEAHGLRVVVANTRKLKAISDAKAKTDRLDARTLAKLGIARMLDPVWTPYQAQHER